MLRGCQLHHLGSPPIVASLGCDFLSLFHFLCGADPLISNEVLLEKLAMHFDQSSSAPVAASTGADDGPWYKSLDRYHWFVFIVATLGWLFDTMDQQLFNIARTPAMRALVEPEAVARYSGYATSIFLIGWGAG